MQDTKCSSRLEAHEKAWEYIGQLEDTKYSKIIDGYKGAKNQFAVGIMTDPNKEFDGEYVTFSW